MDESKPPPKPAVDLAAIGVKVSAWLKAAGRGVGTAWTKSRISLGRAAAGIPHVPTRNFLVGVLTPKVLPVETGDAFGGLEGQLRASGFHSGIHSQPSPEQLRASGSHPRPSAPDLSGGSNPRPKAPMKRVPPRMGGTFTPAAASASSGPKASLTGGSKKLSEDELQAIKHDAQRRKEEAKARAVIDKFRSKLGKFKLEKLGELPRTFAPDALAAFQTAHPAVTAETIQLITPLVAGLSRDVCDRAAVRTGWSEAERLTFVNAIPPEARERLKAAIEALTAMPGEARQALLRLPRAPVAAPVETLAKKWGTLPVEEIRMVALALAQFHGAELTSVIRAPAPPVKIAPTGIRG